jgi:hypothetical protein
MKTKNAFWLTVVVDIALLALAIILGWQVMRILNPTAIASSTTPSATPKVYKPLDIEVQIPEGIVPQREYDLRIQIDNPADEPVTIKQIVFPITLLDNSSIMRSNPPLGNQSRVDDGVGFTLDLTINPGEQQILSVTLMAKKMQAVSGKLVLYTDHARQEKNLVVVIAPLPDTATPTLVTPSVTPPPVEGTPTP